MRRAVAPAIALALLASTPWLYAAPRIEIGSGRFGNTFVVGEAPALHVGVAAAPGEEARGVLAVTVRDAYGAPAGRLRAAVDLAPGAEWRGAFPIASRRLGHFTVSATVSDGRGRRLAVASATAAILPPVEESDASRSGVGYYVVPFAHELAQAEAIATQMRRFGIRWVRLGFDWAGDARRQRPDRDDPAWLDTANFERWVDHFRAQGIEVLGAVFGTARWASSRPDDVEIDDHRITYPGWALVAPAALDDWGRLVRTLAERLRGRVRHWEIWNEPDSRLFWRSTAGEFAGMVEVAGRAVRAVDPEARVALNFVDRGRPDAETFQRAVLSRAGSEIDILGWHYGDVEAIAAARGWLPGLRAGAVIWNTEAYGVPRRLISRWLQQRAEGVERLFPFVYHLPTDDALLGLARFGLYPVNLDYTPRPDVIALRTLSDLVGSATPAGGGAVGFGWSAYAFRGTAGLVVALVDGNDPGLTWQPSAATIVQLALPATVRRVEVIDLMGNRFARRVVGGRLRLAVDGVAVFLRGVPEEAIPGLRVARSRAARR